MDIKGNDWLYIAGGAAVLYLVLKNQNVLSETIEGAGSVVNPLLTAVGKGTQIVTNPKSYEYTTYLNELLKAPFTPKQSWQLFRQQPNIDTFFNAVFTNVGVMI